MLTHAEAKSISVKVNGQRVHMHRVGEGPDVVLLHALGMSGGDWYHQHEKLSAHFRLWSLDLPGHGRSDPLRAPFGLGRMAEHVLDALSREGVSRFALVGVSMGGMIAQHMALMAPTRVKKLVLNNTSARVARFGPLHRVALSLGARLHGRVPVSFWAKVQARRLLPDLDAQRRYLAGYTPPLQRAYADGLRACVDHDLQDRLADLRVPTLVIVGTRDRVIDPRQTEALARLIPGARLLKIEGSNHATLTERHEEFNAALLDFLSDP